jgi:hypothetical protein
VCALIFAAGVLLAGHLAGSHAMPVVGILTAVAAAFAAAMLGQFLLVRTGKLSFMRSESSNLVAIKSGAGETPDVWLVAHTDSKSQTIGMLVRVGSVALTLIFFSFMLGAMAAQLTAFPELTGVSVKMLRAQSIAGSLLTALAILPVALCFITNKSRGALDNATGVAAVLLAIENIPAGRNVGVLLTSAEELGLAGARHFAATRADKGIAINCDTIDNSGRFICMTNDLKRRDAVAMAKAGASLGVIIQVRRVISGILTDSMAFTRGGWESCTLSRGNLDTLGRVHTRRDEPGRIDGAGVALAARILAATVEELS